LVHHALGIAAGEVTMAERTMYNFRARAAGDPAVLQVFEDLTDQMISALSPCPEVQRLDSTLVSSNMVHLSRLQLFVQTMERLVAKLAAEQLAVLPEAIQERYLERAGSFADTTGANSRHRLGQAAQDLAFLVDHFAADVQVRDLPAYGLVVRLFGEQCAVQTDGENNGILRFSTHDYALALSRARQQTDRFRQFYTLRSGIEATNAAQKTAHGSTRLWARGRDRVNFAVLMKTLALNFKRYAGVWCAQMARIPT
jgi:hypothetical protein